MQHAATTGSGGQDRRLESVDIVRGFALMALFLVHMIESYELYWADPKTGPISDTVYLLFMGKSFSLLALCFGFSFFILMDRAAQRGVDFTARFAWRLAVLFGIGFGHAVIYRGDIIQLLALMGFVLLAFHRVRSNRALIAVAIVCFVSPISLVQLAAAMSGAGWANQPPNHFSDPAMAVYLHGNLAEHLRANLWDGQLPKWWFMLESGRITQILGLYLVGMVLGRIGFFARLGEFARARWIALALAAASALALYFLRDGFKAWFAAQQHGAASDRLLSYLLGSWFELAGTAVWLLVLLALFQSPARPLLRPLAGVGRTTLTLYILQSIVFVPVFYGFGLGLYDDWNQATRLWVGLAAIAGQLALAHWWLARFRYGPVEWVWRALTYWRRDIPFRGAASA
ncbi:DUF418 domain-containing protein [Sphingomonas sp. LM7]|uniref:DUF418 domain-containing protein n=1 Tax=Sphingomonas sp. LM7 TaxID=1938607 RepID=UPI000983AC96|nr:DUF418 domain-containing protein [Sphingomonas sp. LM7]AQR74445.1 hypothetical protein BXU08_12970 [Sphingomonas sp. LM7]